MGERTAAEYVREARAAVVLLVEAVEALVAADERTERRIAALEQAAVPATPTPVAQPSACGHPLREQGPGVVDRCAVCHAAWVPGPAHAKATEQAPTPPAEPVTGSCPACKVPYDGCLHRAQAEEAASEPVTGQMWEQRATAAESALAALRAACVLSEGEREAHLAAPATTLMHRLQWALDRITKEAEVKP